MSWAETFVGWKVESLGREDVTEYATHIMSQDFTKSMMPNFFWSSFFWKDACIVVNRSEWDFVLFDPRDR